MRRSIRLMLLTLGLLATTGALAADEKAEKRRRISEFQDVTDEDRAAARERSRNRLGTFSEPNSQTSEYRFPWMAIGFTVLALGIAVPFAWSAYNRASKEQVEANAFAQPTPRKKKIAADAEE
ncbi:MAG: hypothetical protein ACOZQL_10375 [Myxococcota bacterium]